MCSCALPFELAFLVSGSDPELAFDSKPGPVDEVVVEPVAFVPGAGEEAEHSENSALREHFAQLQS